MPMSTRVQVCSCCKPRARSSPGFSSPCAAASSCSSPATSLQMRRPSTRYALNRRLDLLPSPQSTLDSIAKSRVKPMVRTLFVAMGFTTLYLLWLIKPAIEPQQAALYHWSGPAHNFFLPVTIDFLAFWFLLALLLLAA